jgi:hypothetical protein
MKICYISIFALFIAFNVQAENMYRWVDKEGKVHYGDQPTEDAMGVEQRKFASPSAPGEDELSYSTRKAKAEFPITLYVTSNCGDICIQARAFLNKRGIPFTEKNLQTQVDVDTFKAKTGGNGIPALTIGKTLLNGFEIGQWNNELDIAGYPKEAPYGYRPQQPVVPKTIEDPANPYK